MVNDRAKSQLEYGASRDLELSQLYHLSGLLKDISKEVIGDFGASSFYLMDMKELSKNKNALDSLLSLSPKSLTELRGIFKYNFFIFDFKNKFMLTTGNNYGKSSNYNVLIRFRGIDIEDEKFYKFAKSKLRKEDKVLLEGHTLGYMDHCFSKMYFLSSLIKSKVELIQTEEDGPVEYLITREELSKSKIGGHNVDLFKVLNSCDNESLSFLIDLFPEGPLRIADLKDEKIHTFSHVDGLYLHETTDRKNMPYVYSAAEKLFNKKDDFSALYA
ncbi:hypothetical protein M1139_00980 [Candidatus Parvarchaeota archaeon]|nr:hypothetical protein [Candidatus Parvarchaeota archaeon]